MLQRCSVYNAAAIRRLWRWLRLELWMWNHSWRIAFSWSSVWRRLRRQEQAPAEPSRWWLRAASEWKTASSADAP